MTDLEKFIELYKSFGIDLKQEPFENDWGGYVDDEKPVTGGHRLELCEGDSDKFVGYTGFCSEVVFDKKGKFVRQGFWE